MLNHITKVIEDTLSADLYR